MRVETETSDSMNPVARLANGRPIALVGLMGAGKTSVGRRLSQHYALPFYDSDDEIEKAAGLCISDIFTFYGEAEFRRGEQRVIERLLNGPQHVLATGGGAYMNADTRAMLKEKALTIWLRADLETLWNRVNKRDTRPLLKTENPKDRLKALLDERAPLYAEADIVVESQDGPHHKVVDDVVAAIEAWAAK